MNKQVESLISNMNPKRLFMSSSYKPKSKNKNKTSSTKRRSHQLSRSDPPSSSNSSSEDDNSNNNNYKGGGSATPLSVLPDDTDVDHGLLVDAFKLIDRDGDGKISISELQRILSRVDVVAREQQQQGRIISKEEVAAMLSELDSDGDGCLSLEEFGAGIGSAFHGDQPAGTLEELHDAFDFFDVNRDGMITAEELLEGFTKLGDDRCTLIDCKRMIADVDVNKDGYVCFDDFSRMMIDDGRAHRTASPPEA